MPAGAATLAFDHVHLVCRDAGAAAQWYVTMLGARMLNETTVLGAPQVYLAFGESLLILRELRKGESAASGSSLRWGVDHFGFRVDGDFDAFCASLRERGVRFTMEPMTVNEATRAAYIEGPDGVRIELLLRSEWPDLVTFGLQGPA